MIQDCESKLHASGFFRSAPCAFDRTRLLRLPSCRARNALMTVLALVAALSAMPAPAAADVAATPPPAAASRSTEAVALEEVVPTQIVHRVVMQNPESVKAALQREVTASLVRAERALYDPVLTSRVRSEYSDLPWSAEDPHPASDIFNPDASKERTTERRAVAEAGVSMKMPTGGKLDVMYRLQKRRVITSGNIDEYRGAVSIAIKQPLLRGLGRAMTEADLRVAELEQRIDVLRYEEQVLKTAGESVNAYWQLYRAEQGAKMRREALESSRQAFADVERRVKAGWAPATDLMEAEIAASSRDADLARAERLVEETLASLRTLLNRGAEAADSVRFRAVAAPRMEIAPDDALEQRMQTAFSTWPRLRVAGLRVEQERIRAAVASDQTLPDLRLEVGYNRNSLDRDSRRTIDRSWDKEFSGWYSGLEMEMPLGNRRADSRLQAQLLKVNQGLVEFEGVRSALRNDVSNRWQQMLSAQREVVLLEKEVNLRERLLQVEREQYRIGRVRLSRVIEREDELTQSRQSLIDSSTRFELARLALDVADGSLLRKHEVSIEVEEVAR